MTSAAVMMLHGAEEQNVLRSKLKEAHVENLWREVSVLLNVVLQRQ